MTQGAQKQDKGKKRGQDLYGHWGQVAVCYITTETHEFLITIIQLFEFSTKHIVLVTVFAQLVLELILKHG